MKSQLKVEIEDGRETLSKSSFYLFFPKLLLKIIVEFELKRYFDNYLSPTGYALKAN